MFQLKSNNGISFFESSLLRQTGMVRHAFSTRLGGVSKFPYDSLNLGYHTKDYTGDVRQNREIFARAFAFDPHQFATVRFVHGTDILEVDLDSPREGYVNPEAALIEADAMSTKILNQPLFISFADCAPLLFVDPVHRAVAAAHAGWRGVAAGLPAKMVQHMTERYGSNPNELLVALGPMIGPKEFEVGPDVVEAFKERTPRWKDLFIPGAKDRSYLDIPTAIRWQLQEEGVLEQQIDVCPWTTADRPELFFSYRRSGPDLFGVMGALIALV